jgi:hypothetical protein
MRDLIANVDRLGLGGGLRPAGAKLRLCQQSDVAGLGQNRFVNDTIAGR